MWIFRAPKTPFLFADEAIKVKMCLICEPCLQRLSRNFLPYLWHCLQNWFFCPYLLPTVVNGPVFCRQKGSDLSSISYGHLIVSSRLLMLFFAHFFGGYGWIFRPLFEHFLQLFLLASFRVSSDDIQNTTGSFEFFENYMNRVSRWGIFWLIFFLVG